MSRPTVSVVQGDIAEVRAQALITAINSSGMWFGGIDGVIQRCAGSQYHDQAGAAMPLEDGQTVVVKQKWQHKGRFFDVVFVVDDLVQPLRNIVAAGLRTADARGYESVMLPTIRMGVMRGAVEKTIEETVGQMVKGIGSVLDEATNLQSITIVVYNDAKTQKLLEKTVAKL